MSTLEEVRIAERAMREADKTLRRYRKRAASEQNETLHRQLTATLRAATSYYLNLVRLLSDK